MDSIFDSLATYGYIVLLLYSFGGGFIALVGAGVLSYAGKMDITTSILIATTANFFGDMFLFYMSRYNKEVMMPYIKNHRRKFALSHLLMKRYGDRVIFIQKYIYGIKTLIPLAIGLTKYDVKRFGIYNFFASIIWGISIGLASFYSGQVVIDLIESFKDRVWLAPVILFSILGLIWFYMEKVTKRKIKK